MLDNEYCTMILEPDCGPMFALIDFWVETALNNPKKGDKEQIIFVSGHESPEGFIRTIEKRYLHIKNCGDDLSTVINKVVDNTIFLKRPIYTEQICQVISTCPDVEGRHLIVDYPCLIKSLYRIPKERAYYNQVKRNLTVIGDTCLRYKVYVTANVLCSDRWAGIDAGFSCNTLSLDLKKYMMKYNKEDLINLLKYAAS